MKKSDNDLIRVGDIKSIFERYRNTLYSASYFSAIEKSSIRGVLDVLIGEIYETSTIEQPTWISCEERLPAESGYYLVVYRDKFDGSKLVSIDFYTKCTAGEWWDNDFGRTAIYWMPLPEPPKE